MIVLLTISNTVQNAIIGADNSLGGGLIGATTLLALNAGIVRFLYHHKKIDRLVEGDPVVLIKNGELLEDRLKHELITKEELEGAARRQGYSGLDNIDYAVLEAGGTLSCIGKKSIDEHYDDLVQRLEAISKELSTIKSGLSK